MGNLQQSAFRYLNWLLLCIVVHILCICVYCLLSCVLLSLKGRGPLWNWGVTIGDLQPSCSQWAVDRHKVSWVKTGESWEQTVTDHCIAIWFCLFSTIYHVCCSLCLYLSCLLLAKPVHSQFRVLHFSVLRLQLGFPWLNFIPHHHYRLCDNKYLYLQLSLFVFVYLCICVFVYLCICVSRVYLCIVCSAEVGRRPQWRWCRSHQNHQLHQLACIRHTVSTLRATGTHRFKYCPIRIGGRT